MSRTRREWSRLLPALAGLLLLAAGPALAAEEAYVIGPEDVLDVQVWDNKDLNLVTFVRPDGKISLPLLGEVHAAGKTVKQLEDVLVAEYAKRVKGPVVTVIVREIRSRPVHFIGGFGRPGVMQLTRDMTLLEAVSVLGGIAQNGDAEKGYLIRDGKRIAVDFDALVQKGDLRHNLRLQPGDSVVVPVADLVYVEGEVRRPGAVKYTRDLTIVKAITHAGGLTPMAAPGRVDILRGGKDSEKRVRIRVDLDKILRAPDDNPDVKLRPDDVIFVPQRLF